MMTRFVPDGRVMWPLSAIGYLALAGSFVAAMRGSRRIALALLLVPIALALAAGYERTTGIHVGIDHLLFADRLRALSIHAPGRPGIVSIGSFLLLSIAFALATCPSTRSGHVVTLLASLSLAVGTLAVTMELLQRGAPTFGAPIPTALAAMLLAIGLLAWRAQAGWPQAFAVRAREPRRRRSALPLIVLLPLLSALLHIAMVDAGSEPTEAVLITAFVNVAIVATLLSWSSKRLLSRRRALDEVTAALDTAPVAIVDRAGCITHWSHGCVQLYGWSAEEAIGQHMDDLLRSKRPAPTATRPAQPDTFERIDRHRDGRRIHVIARRAPIALHGRDPVTAVAITDISDRIAIEDELRATASRLDLALDAHAVGVLEWDIDSGTLEWTPGSEQRLGLAPGSIQCLDGWVALIEPDDWAAIQTTLAGAVARRAPFLSFHYRFRQPNGVVRAIDGSLQAFYDENGRLVRAIGVNVDVTERDDRRAMLKTREAQLRSILQTVPDAMVVIDEAGTILSFSRTAEQLFGYGADEVVGDDIDLLMPPARRHRHRSLLARYLRTSGRRAFGQARFVTAISAAGVEIPVELRIGEAIVGDHRLFTGFIRDLRHRLDAEERLNTLRGELTHLNRLSAMGELATGLAHELNQPLAATVNFLATADRLLTSAGPDIGRSREMIEMASDQTLRAGKIIRRLREFVARREPEVRGEPVAAAIEDAVALLLVGQGQRDVRVAYALADDATLMFADRIQIQQVLVNLMRNAIEAMRSANSAPMALEIASRVIDAETLEISVADSGPGIAKPVLANLYTPFTTTKDAGGLGVGLSICRRIIEAHGGALYAENRPGGGALFRFTLPMINERELGEA